VPHRQGAIDRIREQRWFFGLMVRVSRESTDFDPVAVRFQTGKLKAIVEHTRRTADETRRGRAGRSFGKTGRFGLFVQYPPQRRTRDLTVFARPSSTAHVSALRQPINQHRCRQNPVAA